MSLDYFPVAFYDEASIWEHFSAQINSRLPIYGVNLNLPEGDILMPPLPIKFISHTESFWHEDLEFTYKRPYLWIFILKFTNFEIFKRDIKPKLKELVSQMQKWTIEWLVVFVPSFTRLVKSDHKTFLASYSKVQNEVLSMTGKQNVTKFYCSSNKTFVDLSQPSCIKDEYWINFIKSVGKGVSIGIQTAICTHLKASCLHMDQNFELYSLNLYALGLLYEAIGVRNQTCQYLELIREKVFVSKLVHSYKNDFLKDLELNGEEFERFLIKSELSKVWCLRYLTDALVNFLNQSKSIEKSAWTANNSLEILWSLYNLTPCFEFLKFIYFYSDRFQLMFFSLMNDVDKENRQYLYLSLGNLMVIKLNSMIALNRSAEMQEALNQTEFLELTRRIYDAYAFAGYTGRTLLYKHLASTLALSLSSFDLIGEIINQHSDWPSIDSLNKQLLLIHDKSLTDSEKMKYISEICSHQYLDLNELQSLWSKLVLFSQSSSAIYTFSNFKTYTFKNLQVKQGKIIRVKFLIINPLAISIFFHKLTAKYSKDFGLFELSACDALIRPGYNWLELGGVAWDSGCYRLEALLGQINKYSCHFPVLSAYIEVDQCKTTLKPRLHSLVLNGKRVILLELKSFNLESQDVQISVSSQGKVRVSQAEISEYVEIFVFSFHGKEKKVGKIVDGKLVLEGLSCNCFSFMFFEVKSEGLNEVSVQFDVNSAKGGSEIGTIVKFDEGLDVKARAFGTFATFTLKNNYESIIKVNSISCEGLEQAGFNDQLPVLLEYGQEFHGFVNIKEFPLVLTVEYFCLIQGLEKIFADELLKDKKQELAWSIRVDGSENL